MSSMIRMVAAVTLMRNGVGTRAEALVGEHTNTCPPSLSGKVWFVSIRSLLLGCVSSMFRVVAAVTLMRNSVGTRAEALVGEHTNTCPPSLSGKVCFAKKWSLLLGCVGSSMIRMVAAVTLVRNSVGTRAEALVGEHTNTCPPSLSGKVCFAKKWSLLLGCVGSSMIRMVAAVTLMRNSVGTRAEALVGEHTNTCPPSLSGSLGA